MRSRLDALGDGLLERGVRGVRVVLARLELRSADLKLGRIASGGLDARASVVGALREIGYESGVRFADAARRRRVTGTGTFRAGPTATRDDREGDTDRGADSHCGEVFGIAKNLHEIFSEGARRSYCVHPVAGPITDSTT
jgi:hypothetical protein